MCKCPGVKVSLVPTSIGRGTALPAQSKQEGEWQGGGRQVRGLRQLCPQGGRS